MQKTEVDSTPADNPLVPPIEQPSIRRRNIIRWSRTKDFSVHVLGTWFLLLQRNYIIAAVAKDARLRSGDPRLFMIINGRLADHRWPRLRAAHRYSYVPLWIWRLRECNQWTSDWRGSNYDGSLPGQCGPSGLSVGQWSLAATGLLTERLGSRAAVMTLVH